MMKFSDLKVRSAYHHYVLDLMSYIIHHSVGNEMSFGVSTEGSYVLAESRRMRGQQEVRVADQDNFSSCQEWRADLGKHVGRQT